MTKVELRFTLGGPLSEALLARLAEVHDVYGIYRVRVAPAMDGLLVEYDATRLNAEEVAATLTRAGIPVRSERP